MTKDYMIYPKLYCSCRDFYKNVVINRKRDYCKHILAQIISEALNSYEEKILDENQLRDLIRDIKMKI